MTSFPLISIIVPIYNVESYLDACIKSIVSQTYSNLEILLIDDGSSDSCPILCESWAETDSRIKVIHKQNGGLSDARNYGLREAHGMYVAFIDGDDTIAPAFISNLYQAICETGSQIAMCSILQVWSDGRTIPLGHLGYAVYDNKEGMRALIKESIRQTVCNKLYSYTLVNNLWFPKDKYHEDEFWSYQVFGRATQSVKIDYIGYYYYQHSESIMGAAYSLKRLDAIEALSLRQEYIEEYYPSLSSLAKHKLLFSCLYHGQLAFSLEKSERKVALSFISVIVRKYPVDHALLTKSHAGHKIWLILEWLNLPMTCRLRNVLKIGL